MTASEWFLRPAKSNFKCEGERRGIAELFVAVIFSIVVRGLADGGW